MSELVSGFLLPKIPLISLSANALIAGNVQMLTKNKMITM